MKSDVVLEQKNGKKTGYGLVFFNNEETALNAKQNLNNKKIGTRYIELLTCSHNDIIA